MRAWAELAKALAGSTGPADRKLSASIIDYVSQTPSVRSTQLERTQRGQQALPGMNLQRDAGAVQLRSGTGPDISR